MKSKFNFIGLSLEAELAHDGINYTITDLTAYGRDASILLESSMELQIYDLALEYVLPE